VTIEALLETVFSTRSVPRSDKEDNWGNQVSSVRGCVKVRVVIGSCEGAAVQSGLEHGSRGTLEAHTRKRLVKTHRLEKT
jgi:hypothetical protein